MLRVYRNSGCDSMSSSQGPQVSRNFGAFSWESQLHGWQYIGIYIGSFLVGYALTFRIISRSVVLFCDILALKVGK